MCIMINTHVKMQFICYFVTSSKAEILALGSDTFHSTDYIEWSCNHKKILWGLEETMDNLPQVHKKNINQPSLTVLTIAKQALGDEQALKSFFLFTQGAWFEFLISSDQVQIFLFKQNK